MNKVAMFAGAAGAAVLFAGCGPDLAQTDYGEKEAGWQEVFRENYSGYEAPRTSPPAVVDNVSPRLIEEEQMNKTRRDDSGAPVPSEDPQTTVDKAADSSSGATGTGASQDEVKKADGDKKADGAKKADAAKQANADKKADTAKQDDGKTSVKSDIYEVVAGDSLGKIAKKFYGDARCFDIIVNANEQLKANPDKLRVGMKLVIPKI